MRGSVNSEVFSGFAMGKQAFLRGPFSKTFALATVCSRNTNVIMVCGNRMLLEHECYHGLGMGALATVCSWNTDVIMVWAWMLWQAYAPRACCAGTLTRCRAVAERLTFQNVRFIRGRSWRTYRTCFCRFGLGSPVELRMWPFWKSSCQQRREVVHNPRCPGPLQGCHIKALELDENFVKAWDSLGVEGGGTVKGKAYDEKDRPAGWRGGNGALGLSEFAASSRKWQAEGLCSARCSVQSQRFAIQSMTDDPRDARRSLKPVAMNLTQAVGGGGLFPQDKPAREQGVEPRVRGARFSFACPGPCRAVTSRPWSWMRSRRMRGTASDSKVAAS